jgi:hypothetical protein
MTYIVISYPIIISSMCRAYAVHEVYKIFPNSGVVNITFPDRLCEQVISYLLDTDKTKFMDLPRR